MCESRIIEVIFILFSVCSGIKTLSSGEIPTILLHLIHKQEPGKYLESSATDQLWENLE